MTPFVQSLTNLLSFFTVVFDIFAAILFFILITPLRRRGWTKSVAEFFGERAVFFSFLIAFIGVGGSLFFSDIAQFQPCLLCWWLRVLLYPQAILLFVALIRKDPLARLHSIIFSGIGALLGVYQVFLQLGFLTNDLIPCDASGVSCQHVYFLQYGYVTIPTMALTAFVLILLFMFSPNPRQKDVHEL